MPSSAAVGSAHAPKTSALWIQHDAEGPDSYEAFLGSADVSDPDLDIDADSAVLVIYTAAMSGRQCGSMLSQNNLISQGLSVAWLGDIDDATSFLNSGPMFHIGNYQFWGLPTLLLGGNQIGADTEAALRERFGRSVSFEPRPPAYFPGGDDDIPF